MKKLSSRRLAQTVAAHRKALKLTQAQLTAATGINRALLSRMEGETYVPSVDQLLALSDVLQFDIHDVWEKPEAKKVAADRSYRIAVAGMGYVGWVNFFHAVSRHVSGLRMRYIPAYYQISFFSNQRLYHYPDKIRVIGIIRI